MKRRSATIMATTPGPRNSYFMNLVALKDEKGQPRLPLLRFGEPCQACQRSSEPWTCLHNLDDLPQWHDRGKRKVLMYLYQGDRDTYLREMFAASMDDSIRPFKPEYIAHLKQKPLYQDGVSPAVVYLTVDSAFGGRCEFAILGAYFPHPGVMVIIYIDAFHLKDGDYIKERDRVQAAVKSIQGHPKFYNVPIVFVPENAPGNAGQHLKSHLAGYPNILTLKEYNQGDGLGVKVTEDIRDDQTRDATILLANHAVFYSENLMTYPDLSMPLERRLDALRDKLEKQLVCWENVIEADPADVFKKVRRKWTSKLSAGNDDLAICFVMMWWHKRFLNGTRPEYVEFWQNTVMPRMIEFSSSAHIPPGGTGPVASLPRPVAAASRANGAQTPMELIAQTRGGWRSTY